MSRESDCDRIDGERSRLFEKHNVIEDVFETFDDFRYPGQWEEGEFMSDCLMRELDMYRLKDPVFMKMIRRKAKEERKIQDETFIGPPIIKKFIDGVFTEVDEDGDPVDPIIRIKKTRKLKKEFLKSLKGGRFNNKKIRKLEKDFRSGKIDLLEVIRRCRKF